MEMRQVVTGTLAWTGLVVVVAVPSAEALLARLTHPATVPHMQPADLAVAPRPVAIAPKPVAASAGAGAVPAVKQAAMTRPASDPAPIAAADSPLSVKPATPAAVMVEAKAAPSAAPKVVAKATTAADTVAPIAVGSMPPASTGNAPSGQAAPVKGSAADVPFASPGEVEAKPAAAPDGVQVATSETGGTGLTDGLDALPAPPPVPMPAADRPKAAPVRVVTADELDGWKSGSLADYLRQHNLANAANSAPDAQN